MKPICRVMGAAVLLVFLILVPGISAADTTGIVMQGGSNGSTNSQPDPATGIAAGPHGKTPVAGMDSQEYARDTLIVRFRDRTDDPSAIAGVRAREAHETAGATVEKDFSGGGIHGLQVVHLPEGTDVPSAIRLYESNPAVLYAEPDYRISVFSDETGPVAGNTGSSLVMSIPNDARFSEQWGFRNTGLDGGTPDADIDMPEAWDRATGSDTVIVAVIDTGVFYNHEDLSANIWTNADEIPGNGKDDDHNGYVDDIHGWDFINNDNDPSDDYNHGTHCAGVIGATGNNALGVAGVNWRVAIMPLKTMDSGGNGTVSQAIEAFGYARANGAFVISNSWGGINYSQGLKDAIDASPAVVVFSAGNDGKDIDSSPVYPASYTSANLISVAATDNRDIPAGFSNYGQSSVDLAAPGVNILSTRNSPGYYILFSGTSMAAPHVSGVAALLKSINMSLTSAEIKKIILDNVDVKGSLTGKVATGGRLNAGKAVRNWNHSMVMEVFSITPNHGPNTTSVMITDFAGANFRTGTRVQLNQSGIAGPVHTGSIKDGSGGALMQRPNSIVVSGNYAYIPGLFSDSLEIVDVTDPAHPVHTGSIKNGDGGALLSFPYAVAVSGNAAYVASYGSNALEIVNVTDPAHPVHQGSLTDDTGGALLGGPQAVFVAGNTAYVASRRSNALEIVDVTDPAHPVHQGSITDGTGGALLGSPQAVFVAGNTAYVASAGSNALEVVDVTDPAHPVHKGSITDGEGGSSLESPADVFVSGSSAYVASYWGSALEIVNVTDPAKPVHQGRIADGEGGALLGGPKGVVVVGDFAYVASSGSNALEIVDVTDPAKPFHKSSIINGAGGALLDWPTDVAVSGHTVYIASWNSDALEIIDPGFIPAENMTVVSPVRITCRFNLAGRPAGLYNVIVSDPGAQPEDPLNWNHAVLVNGFTVTASSPVRPLPGYTNPPTDPDGDGIYEDLNANGRKDFADVVLYFNQMSWIAVNEPVSAFDLNGNGRIDFADIVALFNEI